MEDYNKYAIKCFKDEAEAILDLIPQLTEDFSRAVDLVFHSKGRFIITGVGKSGHVGAKIAATLGMFTPDDVVMAISYSGNTDELLRFLPLLIERNIPIIGVSGNPQSLLAQYSTCHLNIKVKREADPNNLAPTSSTTATLAMGDAIACALIEARNFQPMDFAQFHPGGSLGKRLLSRVKDFMVSKNLPIVTLEQKISDTIIEISKTKQGIAVAVESGKIAGVVTDGDVRRAMQNNKECFFDLTVKDIMSTTPKTISETAKLQEAGDVMRRYNIHSLVVVNESNELVGIIDAFSCI